MTFCYNLKFKLIKINRVNAGIVSLILIKKLLLTEYNIFQLTVLKVKLYLSIKKIINKKFIFFYYYKKL